MRERRAITYVRRLARIGSLALGLVAVIASGGGAVGFPDTSAPTAPPLPPEPYVAVFPGEPTVQAGTVVRFEARTANMTAPVQYQWRRDGVDIAGATSPTYVLGGAQAGDDGALFQVVAAAPNGVAVGFARLRVSPLPPVVFEDSTFSPGDWTVAATPSSNGPTFTASQSTGVGNPAPSRLLAHQLPAGVSSLQLVHRRSTATYSPATQGAVYTIDFGIDCAVVSRSAGLAPLDPRFAVTLEQAGRLYQLYDYAAFCGSPWSVSRGQSLLPDKAALLSGPACAPGDRCPDFTVAGAPMQFGFVTWVSTASASVAGTLEVAIDNWSITVWRR